MPRGGSLDGAQPGAAAARDPPPASRAGGRRARPARGRADELSAAARSPAASCRSTAARITRTGALGEIREGGTQQLKPLARTAVEAQHHRAMIGRAAGRGRRAGPGRPEPPAPAHARRRRTGPRPAGSAGPCPVSPSWPSLLQEPSRLGVLAAARADPAPGTVQPRRLRIRPAPARGGRQRAARTRHWRAGSANTWRRSSTIVRFGGQCRAGSSVGRACADRPASIAACPAR